MGAHARGRRATRQLPRRQNSCPGTRTGSWPRRKLSLAERGAAPLRGEGWRLRAPDHHSHSSGHTGAPSRPCLVSQVARQKRCRSLDGAHRGGPRKYEAQEKARGQLASCPGAEKPRAESSRAGRPRRAGRAHPPGRPNTMKRARCTSPAGSASSGHRNDSLEPRPAPRKRRRPLSPPAQESCGVPLSRLLAHVGALEVALEELRAPGGAFLPVPEAETAEAPQPSASQRAWLSWQLAQAGFGLHWALSALDTLLAQQP